MSIWNIDMGPKIAIGVDSRKTTGEKLKEYGTTNTLLLFDEAMDKLGFKTELTEIIKAAGIGVFPYQMELGEPDAGKCDRAYAFAKENKVDGVVALGGGAAIDTAKLVGKLLANGGKTDDYLGYTNTGGNKVFEPVIVMPTTAGTGAEANARISCMNSKGEKSVATHGATLAIIDPTYTYNLPKTITAGTGVDALAHLVECLANYKNVQNLMADTVGMEGIRIVYKWLPIAYNNPENRESRLWMSYAALLGGYCLKLRILTFGHAIANQISNKYHFPHSVGVSASLPVVIRYLAECEPELTRNIARACDLDITADMDSDAIGKKVIAAFDNLLKTLDIKNMKELGVDHALLDDIVGKIKNDDKWNVMTPPDFDVMAKCLDEAYDF